MMPPDDSLESSGGFLFWSFMSIQDYLNRQAHVGIFGDQIVSPRLDDISVQFQYNLASNDVTSAVTGSGVVEHNGTNFMRVRAGTGAAAGTAKATSVDTVRYRTGHDIYVYFTCYFSAPAASGKQYIGLLDAVDGIAVGYNGTNFGTLYRSGGVDVFTIQSKFNKNTMLAESFGDGSGYVLDPSKVNLYRINLGYLGIAPIIFEVYGGTDYGWLPFHVMEFTNQQTTTHLQNPILPMRVEVESTGNAVLDIHTPSWNAGVLIDHHDEKADRYQATRNAKTGISTETNVLTLKNMATFQSKTNRIVAELVYLSASADGSKNTIVYVKKNATLGGVPSYTNLDATNSVIQKDTAGTTVTGGTLLFAMELGKIDARIIDLNEFRLRFLPGETLTISASSVSASDVSVSTRIRELF
jgi:hypothetical protein